MDPSVIVGEIITLTMMAVALGMDAFSIAIGMGMMGLRLRRVFIIGVTIGVFHVFMPLLGMAVGRFISDHFGQIATYVGAGLLILLGVQMIYNAFQEEDVPYLSPVGFGLFLFALSVSLDSFSVGLGLGIFGSRIIVTVILFGAVSAMLTWLGLLMGRYMSGWLGAYSHVFGGTILLAFGLKMLVMS